MNEKNRVIEDICYEIDQIYIYAERLIPKSIEHSLGFKKEKLKAFVEKRIKEL